MSIFKMPTRSLVLGGLFLIIPLIIIIIIGKHAVGILMPFGKIIVHKMGVSTLFGEATVTIICILLLLFICYIAGLLLKIGMVSNWGDKVEEKIFLLMPQLQIMKYRLVGESSYLKSIWTPILLREEKYYVLVFATSSLDEPIVSIFVPESPKLDSGEIRYIKREDCDYHIITMKQAMDAVMSFGKKGDIQQELSQMYK